MTRGDVRVGCKGVGGCVGALRSKLGFWSQELPNAVQQCVIIHVHRQYIKLMDVATCIHNLNNCVVDLPFHMTDYLS